MDPKKIKILLFGSDAVDSFLCGQIISDGRICLDNLKKGATAF